MRLMDSLGNLKIYIMSVAPHSSLWLLDRRRLGWLPISDAHKSPIKARVDIISSATGSRCWHDIKSACPAIIKYRMYRLPQRQLFRAL